MKKEDYLKKAWGYIELGMHEDFISEIEKAIALDPADPKLFFLKAECQRELKRFKEAIGAYNQSLSLGGRLIENSIGLGWCLKRTGQLDKAIDAISRALESEGEVPILCYNLACYFSLKNKADVSIKLLERASELDPSFLELAQGESDFEYIRNDPRFVSLTGKGVKNS